MKLIVFSVILMASLLTHAQSSNSSSSRANTSKTSTKSKTKMAVGLDYNSWFEILKLKDSSGTSSDMKAQYYGIGINYDHTVYEKTWGYGFLGGYAQGYGLAGQSSSSGTYYEKRVPWTAYRVGARIFTRMNTRLDMGLALLTQFRKTSWKTENGFEPSTVANPLSGFFIETRWRLNYKLELVQSFGQYSKDSSMVWRIGMNYTLN